MRQNTLEAYQNAKGKSKAVLGIYLAQEHGMQLRRNISLSGTPHVVGWIVLDGSGKEIGLAKGEPEAWKIAIQEVLRRNAPEEMKAPKGKTYRRKEYDSEDHAPWPRFSGDSDAPVHAVYTRYAANLAQARVAELWELEQLREGGVA